MKLQVFLRNSMVALVVLSFISCTSSPPNSRYSDKHDSGPTHAVDVSHIPDAVPKHEARTRAGNKNPYTVRGKTYYLIEDERNYKARGMASWYGNKFHGHKTSNGEVYDMYGMTAAHKTLPIPSYVRVTHLDNNRSVVVRVNDRGPFHEGRIIDLSYAAAKKLGITQQGTGRVEVEIIVPGGTPPPPSRSATSTPGGLFLQVGAFTSYSSAKGLLDRVKNAIKTPVFISEITAAKPVYRVRIGPIERERNIASIRRQLVSINIHESVMIRE